MGASRVRYVGHAEGWDEIIYRGSPEDKNFIAFYIKDGKLKAAAGSKHDQEMAAIEFILQGSQAADARADARESFDLVKYAVS